MACKTTNAMMSKPSLIGVDHGRLARSCRYAQARCGFAEVASIPPEAILTYFRIEMTAAVTDSCDKIWLQSRSPLTTAPVLSL
jgi:hypothetical protein